MYHCGVASFFGMLAYSNYSPYTCQNNVYLSNGLIDATDLKCVATVLFNYGYRGCFSRFRQYCIKPVASKIMYSVFKIHVTLPLDMLLSQWMNSDFTYAVIDSSHSF